MVMVIKSSKDKNRCVYIYIYIYSNQKRIEGKRQDKSFLIDYLTWKEKENIAMYIPRTDKLIISFQGRTFGENSKFSLVEFIRLIM